MKCPFAYAPLNYTVHDLTCTLQPRRCTGMGQIFTFAPGGVAKYCISENATTGFQLNMKEKYLECVYKI